MPRAFAALLLAIAAVLGGAVGQAHAQAQEGAVVRSFDASTIPPDGSPALEYNTQDPSGDSYGAIYDPERQLNVYPASLRVPLDTRCRPSESQELPRATQAGAAADLCVRIGFNELAPEGDNPKEIVVDTPTGFAGFASNVPTCDPALFGADSTTVPRCPGESQIGTGVARTKIGTLPTLSPAALAVALPRQQNEVARIGVSIFAVSVSIKVIVSVRLRPAPDVGLQTVITNLPREVDLGPPAPQQLALYGFALRLWGPSEGRPMPARFAVNGTDCTTPQQASIRVTSYAGAESSAISTPYNLTGCDRVNFLPSASVETDSTLPDVPVAAAIKTRFGGGDQAILPSTPKTVSLALPPGLSISAQIGAGAAGLPTCSAAAFAQTSGAPAGCPAGSQVGNVRIKSPFLAEELGGQVFLGEQAAVGELPPLYIQAQLGTAADAPRVKLTGKTIINEQNQLVAQLQDLPQILVSEFDVSLRGGDNSVFVTPEVCGTFRGGLDAVPTANPGSVTSDPIVLTTSGDCQAVTRFAPSVGIGLTTQQAGASAPYSVGFSRPDRTQRFKTSVLDLPPGLVANLKGIPECPIAVAAASACPEASRVGSVTALAGVGPDPLEQSGSVYLVQRQPGEVAAVAIDVRVKVGDIDLGSLVAFGSGVIRPEDQGLRITADVPLRFKGIPTNLRSVTVGLDRPGFGRNPTRCGTLTENSFFVGAAGASLLTPASITVTGCDQLPFDPKVDLGVAGATSPDGRPFVQVQISNGLNSRSLASTEVVLPNGLAVDIVQVARACPNDKFFADACPYVSEVGTITGTLSIADEPITGRVLLLEPEPGSVLPGVGLQITGRFATRINGYTAVNQETKQLVTRFPSLPDIPLETLTINLKGGEGGLLVANESLCDSAAPKVLATFDASPETREAVTASANCGQSLGQVGPVGSAAVSGVRNGRPSVRMNVSAEEGEKIRRVDVYLPDGYRLVNKARAKSSRYVRLSRTGGSTRSRWVRSNRLRLYMPDGGAEQLRLVTRTGLISVPSRKLRASRSAATLRAVVTYEDGQQITVPISTTPRP